MKQPRKRGIKPENSKTVNQWGLRGRIPVDPLKPQYIWDNYYDVPQTIYYLEENTREMTEEEKADFRADRKVFSQRDVKLIADERERVRKKARETERRISRPLWNGSGRFTERRTPIWISF